MKKFNRPTFSQAVLKRRKDRRFLKFRIALLVTFVVVSLSFECWTIYQEHKAKSATKFMPGILVSGGFPALRLQATSGGENEDGVPSHLNINGQAWEVVEIDAYPEAKKHKLGERFTGRDAETDCDNHQITYQHSYNSVEIRENLWHEVMHAGACIHGGDQYWNSVKPTGDKHPGVYHLGEFLGGFSKANPEFMYWMAR